MYTPCEGGRDFLLDARKISMISLILYGRNDNYGYNLHKRAALSLNCMAEILHDDDDEILFVDYNTPDDYPTFPEAIVDTLTDTARRRLRILRVRPRHHARFRDRTHLVALEPVARNVAVRRSNPNNRWILSTNTDMIFVPHGKELLTDIVRDLPDGFYHLPRFEIPESLWETLDRKEPQRILDNLRQWGRTVHLHEIVCIRPEIKYDGPGDFQLILRSDLLRIHGFHEEMLLGWHVDANIAKRLYLIYGRVNDVVDRLFGYHCDHTRQITPAHRHNAIQNDPQTFFDQVTLPEVPAQEHSWGLADEVIEEISLRQSESVFLKALQATITMPMVAPTRVGYLPESFDRITYDTRHVLPFLIDLLSNYPRDIRVGWYGSNLELLKMFAAAQRAIGYAGDILVDSGATLGLVRAPFVIFMERAEVVRKADIFVFDFWSPADDQAPTAFKAMRHAAAPLMDFRHIISGFRAAVAEERMRQTTPDAVPRRFILINAIHNRFEILANTYIEAARTPFSTRIRQGFLLRDAESLAKVRLANMPVGQAGRRDGNRVRTREGVAGHVIFGPYLDLLPGQYRLVVAIEADAVLPGSDSAEPVMAMEVVSGQYMAAYRVLTRADLRQELHGLVFTVPDDFFEYYDVARFEFRIWTTGSVCVSITSIAIEPAQDRIAPVVGDFDWLPLMPIGRAGSRVGHFATPVDTRPGEVGPVVYGPYYELLPGSYRLCCEIEAEQESAPHQRASWESQPALDCEVVLAGGRHLARVPTVLQPGRHAYEVLFSMLHPDVQRSPTTETRSVEFRMHSHGVVPFRLHTIRLERLSQETLFKVAMPSLLWLMQIGPAGVRDGGRVWTRQNVAGHVVFGSYLDLLPGRYHLTVRIEADSTMLDAVPVAPVMAIEAICGHYIAARCNLAIADLRSSSHSLLFTVPDDLRDYFSTPQWEFRIWTSGAVHVAITAITLHSADDEPAPDTRDFDWLPLLPVGPAGIQTDAACSWVSAQLGNTGHIIFGPYVDLLPGSYRLCCEIAADGDSLLPDPKPQQAEVPLTLEVVAHDIFLAQVPIGLRRGVHAYEVSFAISQEDFRRLPAGALEFRAHYSGTVPLELRSVHLRRID
jgi:hypothetical protein